MMITCLPALPPLDGSPASSRDGSITPTNDFPTVLDEEPTTPTHQVGRAKWVA